MKIQKKTRSFNFLVEILVSAVFFSFCSIVCVNLFVYAKDVDRKAKEMTYATMAVQNYIETLDSGVDLLDGKDNITILYNDYIDVIVERKQSVSSYDLYEVKVKNKKEDNIITIEKLVLKGENYE